MRLLRIVSNENDTSNIIKNDFADEIKINPQSKIALINASIGLSNKTLEIDGTNDTFTFKTSVSSSGSNEQQVNLTHGLYSQLGLSNELDIQMNKALSLDAHDQRVEWFTYVDNNDDALRIQFKRGVSEENSNIKFIKRNVNINVEGDTLFKEGGLNGAYDGWVYSSKYFCRGSAINQITLEDASSVVVFGLIKNDAFPASDAVLNPVSYSIAIWPNGITPGKYAVKVTDIGYFGTSYDVSDGDLLAIELSKGQIELYADGQLLMAVEYNYDNIYYPAASFYNNAENLLTPNFDPSPYNSVSDNGGDVIQSDLDGLGVTNTKVTLNFPTPGIRNILGFSDDVYNSGSVTSDYIFEADDEMRNTTTPPSIYVLMNDMKLASYDGSTNRRSSIIATIPFFNTSGEYLVYNAPKPLFIDIDNLYPYNLSSLSITLLSLNGEALNIEERVSLTFAIVDKNEVY